ncbi:uncharacterized protein LOC135093051 [Scylla paramamosain]|uniref:uncharacterized protein LOC135093051 n=1 Tax=Scylla paramamosain TaxID=85552 RepID=UPI003082F880
MKLLRRWWTRAAVHSLRGHVVIVIVFLVFTLHVTTRREKPEENNKGRDLFPIDFEEPREELARSIPPPPDRPPAPFHALVLDPFDDWVEARGSNREFFLYSAYLDKRAATDQVIIVAIVKRRKSIRSCTVWSEGTTTEEKGRVKMIHENWNLPYTAALIICNIPKNSKPTHVALTSFPDTILVVQDMKARRNEGRMSVCVKPLHYEYDRALWLVEFIEFYKLMGVDRFIFYNHTMGPSIDAVVRHYMAENVVTLLPWTLPVTTQKDIRTEGIFAALNDCNLRSVNRFTFSAMVDFDEFLVPRKHDSLIELLDTYGTKDSNYVFQNVFFYLYWENDTTAVYDKLIQEGVSPVEGPAEPYLLTAFKTRRLKKPHKHGVRSKYIVRPERVLELGNHNVWEYIGRKAWKKVPPEDGLSHHYRICEYGGFDCLKQPNMVDRQTHTWLGEVYRSVLTQCAQIFQKEGFCPRAPPLGSPW